MFCKNMKVEINLSYKYDYYDYYFKNNQPPSNIFSLLKLI